MQIVFRNIRNDLIGQRAIGGKKAIGEEAISVQRYLKEVFDLNEHFNTDGSQFDVLFKDGAEFAIGNIAARAIHAPGHTPADMVYDISGNLFVGDTIFAPDMGTARCDFPGGSAATMYSSIRKILDEYPPETNLYLCHDYPEGKNREAMYKTTVADERTYNIHVKDGITESQFIEMRSARDKTLDLPAYIFPSVQINGNAGDLVAGEFIKLSYNKKVL